MYLNCSQGMSRNYFGNIFITVIAAVVASWLRNTETEISLLTFVLI